MIYIRIRAAGVKACCFFYALFMPFIFARHKTYKRYSKHIAVVPKLARNELTKYFMPFLWVILYKDKSGEGRTLLLFLCVFIIYNKNIFIEIA